MTQNKYQNIVYTYTLYDYAIYKYLPTIGFKWIDPKHIN